MGLGGISIWQLLIVLVIVVLIFGTKRLGSLGKDLGGAVKGFRSAMDGAEKEEDTKQIDEQQGDAQSDVRADAQFSEAKEESAEENKSAS